MRYILLSAAGLACAAAPAHAWSEWPNTQPATDTVAVWAYPSKQNYCPAGLQPVVVGGVICCGVPTHVGYRSNNHPKPRHKAYVAHSKGYVATGKGYGEGYRE